MRLIEQSFAALTTDEQAVVNKAKRQICDLYTELLKSGYVRDKETTTDHDANSTTLKIDLYISSLDDYPRYSFTIDVLNNGDITLEAVQRGGIQLAKSNNIDDFIACARRKIFKNPPLRVDWSQYAGDWVEQHNKMTKIQPDIDNVANDKTRVNAQDPQKQRSAQIIAFPTKRNRQPK